MLCPQVWDFKPPPHLISTRVCKTEDEIIQTFQHQYFNHFVSITIPDANQVPKELVDSVLHDSQYYSVNKVSGAEFVKKRFLECFARKGNLTGFSVSDFSEKDRFVVTPCGKLIFSLTKSTYQTIGIEGSFTKRCKNSLRKYFLVVDLLSDSNEAKKMCQLLEKKLQTLKQFYFDVVLAWEPYDENICPSSIAQYFYQKNYKVKTCEVVYNQRFGYNVSVPDFNAESDLSDFVEWLGAYGLQCDMTNDGYISSVNFSQEQIVLGQVIYMTFVGLLTQKKVQSLIYEISKYAEAKVSSMWVSMVVQAFQDSIITIRNQKLFVSDGDQHKTVIFSKNQQPLVYSFKDKKMTCLI